MGLSAVLGELAALEDLDKEVAEYLVSSISDAAEESDEPLDQHSVLELIQPFVEGIGLEEKQVTALASRVAQLLTTPDELDDETLNPTPDEPEQPSQEVAQSAREARRAKLNALEPEPAPEPEQEPQEPGQEPESEADGADQQLAFLRESFPSLSTQEIRQILRQTRGQVDDRAFELLFERQAARSEAVEAHGAPSGATGTGTKSRQLSEAEKREETKRRRALLERYENSASAVAGHRKNATGGLKTVHGRLPTKAEAARQKAAEQRSKVRYFEGAVVTRSGEKYTPVPLSKEEEEREKALIAATSVNLAYKTSKGRRHKGR